MLTAESGDQAILGQTQIEQKGGKVILSLPKTAAGVPLEWKVPLAAFQNKKASTATEWCNIVRGELSAREESQAAKKASKHTRVEPVAASESVPTTEAPLPPVGEFLTKQVDALELRLDAMLGDVGVSARNVEIHTERLVRLKEEIDVLMTIVTALKEKAPQKQG